MSLSQLLRTNSRLLPPTPTLLMISLERNECKADWIENQRLSAYDVERGRYASGTSRRVGRGWIPDLEYLTRILITNKSPKRNWYFISLSCSCAIHLTTQSNDIRQNPLTALERLDQLALLRQTYEFLLTYSFSSLIGCSLFWPYHENYFWTVSFGVINSSKNRSVALELIFIL